MKKSYFAKKEGLSAEEKEEKTKNISYIHFKREGNCEKTWFWQSIDIAKNLNILTIHT